MRHENYSAVHGLALLLAMVVPSYAVKTNAAYEHTEFQRETDQSKDVDPSTAQIVDNAAKAVQRAGGLVGLSEVVRQRARARVVRRDEDMTPFLARHIKGRDLWMVEVAGWRLDLKSTPPGASDVYSRELEVLLDPDDGTLLKIMTRWPENEPPIAPEPSADSAAQQMVRSGLEKYHGFAPNPPLISFIEALDIVQQGGGNPLAAKQLTGVWVLWSRLGQEPRPMWVITLRGIPPIPAAFEGVPIDARNHFRYVVDPVKKRLVFGSSRPQPDARRPTRNRD